MIARTTVTGMIIRFYKNGNKKCINCKFKSKSIFGKRYKCSLIIGLNLDDGEDGHCGLYEN